MVLCDWCSRPAIAQTIDRGVNEYGQDMVYVERYCLAHFTKYQPFPWIRVRPNLVEVGGNARS